MPSEHLSPEHLSPEHLADPLRRFPVFRTSDPEEFSNALLTRFGANRAEVRSRAGFQAQGNLVQLHGIGLVYGASSSGVSVDYPEADRFRLLTIVTGRGEATIDGKSIPIDAHQSCIVSPGQCTRLATEAGHGWFNLRINPGAFEQKLAFLLGAQPSGKLGFEVAVNRDHPQVRNLWRLIRFFSEQLDEASGQLPPQALRELEQAILVAFLYANRHTFSHLLDQEARDTVPSHVRRAEEYIEAHWDEAITIESLVEVTGVGARTIFRAFRQSRGYSPMAFARMVRLRRAGARLSAPDPETSVTEVAFACGFGNLGHFARDYREAFGERPSVTLARAMRTSLP
ncbi:MAG: AraC family transcriptional regulator [Bradyrhizobium sp.]